MSRELVLAWHIHQPFFVPDAELLDQLERSYRPLLAIHRELEVPFALNVTGALLERIATLAPDWVETLAEDIASGRVEALGSGACHPMLPLLSQPRASAQVRADAAIKLRVLGVRPRGFWPADLGWSHWLIPVLREVGISWVTVDSSAKIAATVLPGWTPGERNGQRVLVPELTPLVAPAELGEVHRLELGDGSLLALLRHHALSWDLVDLQEGALHRADRLDALLDGVDAHYRAGADLLVLGDDGERVHPQTLPAYRRILEGLRERGITFVTGSAAVRVRASDASPIYLPTSTFLVDFDAWRTTPDDLVCWRVLGEAGRRFEEVARGVRRSGDDASHAELARVDAMLIAAEDSAFTFWKYLRRTREPFFRALAEVRARLDALDTIER